MERQQARAGSVVQQVRGQRLVDKVLSVALSELVRVDYEKLSFDHIAARAGVNRATLYRHWPKKRDLALDALRKLAATAPDSGDCGSLRLDLVNYLRSLTRFMAKPTTRTFFRIMFAADTELREIVMAVVDEKRARAYDIFRRAVARSELAADAPWEVLHDLLVGFLINNIVLLRQSIDASKLEVIIDVVLSGTQKESK